MLSKIYRMRSLLNIRPSPNAQLYGGGSVYRSSKVMITITLYKEISKCSLLLTSHGYDGTKKIPGIYFFAYLARYQTQALILP